MKKTFYILIVYFLFSCQSERDNFIYLNLSESLTLTNPETHFAFNDKHPVSIKIKDSLAYIIQIQADMAIIILDLKTKKIINNLGQIGYGPDDLLNPNFILTIQNNISDIILEESNLKKIVKIEKSEVQEEFRLKEYIEYPNSLYISSEMNMSKNYIAGRKVGMGEEKMFYIYNRNDESLITIDNYPRIGGSTSDPNYTFAPCIALNEEKDRVIAGMYFFDMFHLYDLSGKKINTFCFSEDCIPKVDKINKKLDLRNGYSGIVRVYPTTDYCYLIRISTYPEMENITSMLIQIDWNGHMVNSYIVPDDISGQFYIDERSNKFYTIRNFIDSEGNDIFDIVSYKLTEF